MLIAYVCSIFILTVATFALLVWWYYQCIDIRFILPYYILTSLTNSWVYEFPVILQTAKNILRIIWKKNKTNLIVNIHSWLTHNFDSINIFPFEISNVWTDHVACVRMRAANSPLFACAAKPCVSVNDVQWRCRLLSFTFRRQIIDRKDEVEWTNFFNNL